MGIDLVDIPGAVLRQDNLPRPQWSTIKAWINGNATRREWDKAWRDVAWQWLELIQDEWSHDYLIRKSAEFLMLSVEDDEGAQHRLEVCERSRRKVLESLPGVAQDGSIGCHVVIACATQDHYYDYISYYYSEGTFATSGGVFLNDDYGHFVLAPTEGQHDLTIAHEMTHNLLRDRALPLWIEEGLAQLMEEAVCDMNYGWPDKEMIVRMRDGWPAIGASALWAGTGFQNPDGDTQELTYATALCLMRRILTDYRRRWLKFVRDAQRTDAGEQSAKKHLKTSLGDILGGLLGSGKWAPGIYP